MLYDVRERILDEVSRCKIGARACRDRLSVGRSTHRDKPRAEGAPIPTFDIIDPGWSYGQRYTFSPAVRKGNLLFISELTATDERGTMVGKGDIVAQTRQIFARSRRFSTRREGVSLISSKRSTILSPPKATKAQQTCDGSISATVFLPPRVLWSKSCYDQMP